jgi:peptidoglycan-N-acetylglucosamine deacetylase
MTRRTFVLASATAIANGAAGQPSIAITTDDLNWMTLPNPTEINTRLLAAMRSHQARLALFVIGRNADDANGQALVQSWKHAGHLIGNHTYSHRNYDSVTFEEFSADVIHADQVLASDLSTPRLFRFPALKEGDTAAKRDRMREFLAIHRYRNGYVTIDASD